jgi:hypothetical protein
MAPEGNSEGAKKLPDDGRLLPKHAGASIQNKGVVQSVHIVCHFHHMLLLHAVCYVPMIYQYNIFTWDRLIHFQLTALVH